MDTENDKYRVVVDNTPSPRTRAVAISITAVAVWGTNLSRTGIRDCQVRSQCYAPGDHHSMSVGLFASLLEQDFDDIRRWATTGQYFVHMSWGFGRGAKPRFETRLILTDDAGAHVRFTHALEQELRLDQYMNNMAKFQGLPQSTDLDEADVEQGAGHLSKEARWKDYTEKVIASARRMQLDRRSRNHVLPVQDHDTDRLPTKICDVASQHNGPLSPSASTLSVLDGSEVDSYQPEDGSYQSEDEPHPQANGSHEPEDDCLDIELRRQLLDEIRYREMADTELQSREVGDTSACPTLYLPSADEVQDPGQCERKLIRSRGSRKRAWRVKDR
ncbi:hypothetical protein CONLIGDRAFT_88831 [Coniochaeta ligniaria NRRL 30616]|uniref:Uncharacterized protein n=1 Tax=Coniochaeta ligniaria NRRL 30616 TaxID=1408157 RepID=A0A1J7JCJ3_9PEZI|nr:hypothetical protein CONLIGDRAFT_88831 [Coniochaeta ligniaria NRRL 30616]